MNQSRKIRWGVLSTGWMAHKFTLALSTLPGAEILAVGSRTPEKADQFGDEFRIPRRYGSYRELVGDPDLDIIYVASLHPFHFENAKLCLEAGKAVLLEKPFTMTAAEADKLIALAHERNLFLMEAMWVRFCPLFRHLKAEISKGLIGKLRMIQSSYGTRFPWQPGHRSLNPDLAGGALLDIGVYPISLASFFFGEPPRDIVSKAHLGETGVDEQSAIILEYSQGKLALLSSAVRTGTCHDSFLYGTDGYIRIHGPWWQITDATLDRNGQETAIHIPKEGSGYNYEAVEAMDCIRLAKIESELMPLDETLQIMLTMDRIRSQWGLRYPFE